MAERSSSSWASPIDMASLDLPNFDKNNIEVLLLQLEAQLHLKGIRYQKTQYSVLVLQLPANVFKLAKLKALMTAEWKHDEFYALRDALIWEKEKIANLESTQD